MNFIFCRAHLKLGARAGCRILQTFKKFKLHFLLDPRAIGRIGLGWLGWHLRQPEGGQQPEVGDHDYDLTIIGPARRYGDVTFSGLDQEILA